MNRQGSADHACVVVVAWDDDSLDSALDAGAAALAGLGMCVLVDVTGFRRLTSRTLEALLSTERLLNGRLVVRSANASHARVLGRAGITIRGASPAAQGHPVRTPA